MKYNIKLKIILLLLIVSSKSHHAFCQKLTLKETLEYLTDLCSQNGFSKGSVTFTLLNKKVKVEERSYAPNYKKTCTLTLLVDIKKLKAVTLESSSNINNDSLFQAKIEVVDNAIQHSSECLDFEGAADSWTFSFLNESSSKKFQKAMMYLKKKFLETNPQSKDPFGD